MTGSDSVVEQKTTNEVDEAPPSLEYQLLLAAAAGDVDEVAHLIELEADVDYQDEEGVSPLMKAAEGGHTAVLAALLQSGAPWNAQDKTGYCAGEYAMGAAQQDAVDLLLDFAVQAELVLGALQRRMQVGAPSSAPNSDYLSQKLVYRGEQLLDADGEAVMMGWERPLMLRHAELICPGAWADAVAPEEGDVDTAAAATAAEEQQPEGAAGNASTGAADEPEGLVAGVPAAEVAAAAGVDAGLRKVERQERRDAGEEQGQQGQPSPGVAAALAPEVAGQPSTDPAEPVAPLGAEQQPDERQAQQQGQRQDAPSGSSGRRGGHVLNVGFGLGIIDTAIQSHHPDRHTIVEAHPDVYEHMVRQGWAAKPGVHILRGRWQDVLPELLAEAPYDGIFFDTYGEYYEEMREFHTQLSRLLARDGVYSFFNGLASDNIFFHMVYCRLISLELAAKGLNVEYETVPVGSLGDDVWQGVRSKYWHFETYFLPRVTHDSPLEAVLEDAEAEGVSSAEAPRDLVGAGQGATEEATQCAQ